MALNPELLALLACPVCRGELEPVDNESGLECPACGLVFPVRDNIPIMLQEEAIRKDGLFAFIRRKTVGRVRRSRHPADLRLHTTPK